MEGGGGGLDAASAWNTQQGGLHHYLLIDLHHDDAKSPSRRKKNLHTRLSLSGGWGDQSLAAQAMFSLSRIPDGVEGKLQVLMGGLGVGGGVARGWELCV